MSSVVAADFLCSEEGCCGLRDADNRVVELEAIECSDMVDMTR